MYQLLLKQRFKFAVRMVKRNIGAYLILIAIVPCILILQSMIQGAGLFRCDRCLPAGKDQRVGRGKGVGRSLCGGLQRCGLLSAGAGCIIPRYFSVSGT